MIRTIQQPQKHFFLTVHAPLMYPTLLQILKDTKLTCPQKQKQFICNVSQVLAFRSKRKLFLHQLATVITNL